jgi:hypothetical protein
MHKLLATKLQIAHLSRVMVSRPQFIAPEAQ